MQTPVSSSGSVFNHLNAPAKVRPNQFSVKSGVFWRFFDVGTYLG